MRYTAAVTLLCLLLSLLLRLAGWGAPVAVLHLAFAVGIVPLIMAAMSHFIPVLTRSGDGGPLIARLPILAQLAGLLAVVAMAGGLPRAALHAAAAVDLLLAAILLRWMFVRAAKCLGPAHPGWRWYALALACLMSAMLVVPPMIAVAGLYAPLRLLHVHLNTLGLLGFAALGTLPLLLPTALGQTDPAAATWLRTRLLPVLASVVLVAVGASLAWPLAVLGGALWLLILLGLLRQWQCCFGWRTLLGDGASASLLAAVIGLLLLSLHGVLHALGRLAAYPAIPLWVAAFLLPLVTGALSQLLPVWCQPGRTTPVRLLMRERLVATGVWRAGLFLAAGLALTAEFRGLGAFLLALAMALFLGGLRQAVRVWRSTR